MQGLLRYQQDLKNRDLPDAARGKLECQRDKLALRCEKSRASAVHNGLLGPNGRSLVVKQASSYLVRCKTETAILKSSYDSAPPAAAGGLTTPDPPRATRSRQNSPRATRLRQNSLIGASRRCLSRACTVVRRFSEMFKDQLEVTFGSLENYFELIAEKAHARLIRSDAILAYNVSIVNAVIVDKRQERTDEIMAMIHVFYEGSQRLHKFFRSLAGGADTEQVKAFGIVLARSWARLRERMQELAPELQLGSIFSLDPPPGTFVNAPEMALKEVVENIESADALATMSHAAYVRLRDRSGIAASTLGAVAQPEQSSSQAYEQCRYVLDMELATLDGLPSEFDFVHDVTHFSCTPKLAADSLHIDLHLVVVFHRRNFGIEGDGVPVGPARATALAETLVALRPGCETIAGEWPSEYGGYAAWHASCFASSARLPRSTTLAST